MSRACSLLISFGVLLGGCTQVVLERKTLDVARTLSDLRYQQVIDNLAMFCWHPDVLPWHVKFAGGNVAVDDDGRLSAGIGFNVAGNSSEDVGVSGSRSISLRWSVTPVTNGTILANLRSAYMKVVVRERAKRMWLKEGKSSDVPNDALYVGSYRGVYVWVTREGLREFTDFTLRILEIAQEQEDNLIIPF